MTKRNNTTSTRNVYNVTKRGPYRRSHKLSRIGMTIRRGDTRHGGTSTVELWVPNKNNEGGSRFSMTLAEARAFRAFLERELRMLAR